MAAGYSFPAKKVMLDALGALAVKGALYTADPGADGTSNEVTGGSYARETVAWSAAGAGTGTMALNGSVVFDVPASTTVSFVGFWNSAGSVFYGSADVTDEVFANAGTYTLTDADLDLNA
jgi:hypothetical protein